MAKFNFEDGNSNAKILTPQNAVELLAYLEDEFFNIAEDEYQTKDGDRTVSRRDIVEEFMQTYNISEPEEEDIP